MTGRRRPRPGTLLAAALGAAAGHAALYGAVLPHAGDHAYLGWYQAVIGAAGLAVLAGSLLLTALAASRTGRPLAARLACRLFPAGVAARPLPERVAGLAAASLVWLVVQESLERSISLGRPALAMLGPGGLLVAALGALGLCLAIALVERLAVHAAQRFLAARPHVARPLDARVRRPAAPQLRRRSPLATRAGLRAPPVPV
jgi:hypothetical protein